MNSAEDEAHQRVATLTPILPRRRSMDHDGFLEMGDPSGSAVMEVASRMNDVQIGNHVAGPEYGQGVYQRISTSHALSIPVRTARPPN